MAQVWIYSSISVLIVSLISFIGVFTLPIGATRLKNILLYFISFSAGALLGDVFIHLLPEIVEEIGFRLGTSINILLGILVSFIIEKIIHLRHAHISEKKRKHPASIMSLVGDAVHNLIDGVIIGASYLVNPTVGIATTLAVVLHEIPQEIGNFGVLIHGGFSRSKALLYNFLTALTAFLGMIMALTIHSYAEAITGFLIPFAAGNFIYLAGADLIPELHKEVSLKKNINQFIVLVLGIAVMLLLLLVG